MRPKKDPLIIGLVNSIAEDSSDENGTSSGDNKLIMKHSIRELLFDGYDDPFLKWIFEEGLSPMNITRFGFLYGRNNSATDGLYTIYTGEGNMNNFGYMFSWNHKKELHVWDDTPTSQCNQLNLTWPGDLRPPYPEREDTAIRLFMPELCR